MELEGEQREEALAKLRTCLEKGMYDDEIRQELCYAPEIIKELRDELNDRESTAVRQRSTEETYAQFVFEQRRCISDLDKIIADFAPDGLDDDKVKYVKNRNINGYVTAVRTKSDIIDKILKTGQDLGLIERTAAAKGLIAGQAIFNMTNIELKQYVVGEMKALYEWMEQFGDKDITALDPGPLHIQVSQPKQPVKAHTRNLVYGGRRVVRGKEE